MIQFYSPEIETSGLLSEEESGHCIRVLRKKVGDEIIVIDGFGKRFHCVITDTRQKKVKVEIISSEECEKDRDFFISLAVAPTKNLDRMEWMVEKAIEIGVDRIDFIRCQRSERKDLKLDRLQRIAVSAMKQSLKCRLTQLDYYPSMEAYLKILEPDSQKFIGYCDDCYERKELAREIKPGKDVEILIGPEGDFTPEEIEKTVNKGFMPVTFGKMRLRTETAAIYGLCAIQVVNNLKLNS